jgi:CRP-like cAMP-binding protein
MDVLTRNGATNALLDRLPRAERAALVGVSSRTLLARGDVLALAHRPIRAVYFPLAGFASYVLPLDGHASLALGIVGREGMIGALFARGASAGPLTSIVHADGAAWRVPTDAFVDLLGYCPRLRRDVERALSAQLHQLARTIACLHFHPIEQRLACWLVLAEAQVPHGLLHFTHQQLADLLGVQRGAVTLAAGTLQRQGLIHYSRGVITVVTRAGLRAAACRCCDPAPRPRRQTALPTAPNSVHATG